jgi:hypothetical protein
VRKFIKFREKLGVHILAKSNANRESTRDILLKSMENQNFQYGIVKQQLDNHTTLMYASFGCNLILAVIILFACAKMIATRAEIKNSKRDILLKLSEFSLDVGKSVNSIETGVNILATITGSKSSATNFEVKGGESNLNNVGRDAKNDKGIS